MLLRLSIETCMIPSPMSCGSRRFGTVCLGAVNFDNQSRRVKLFRLLKLLLILLVAVALPLPKPAPTAGPHRFRVRRES
jgi:hypothetical protein